MSQPLPTLKLIRIVAWTLITALAGVVLFLLLTPDKPRGAAIGGPFVLTSMNGGKLDSAAATKGKPYAVFFGFTQCPDVCPTTMWELSETLRKIDAVRGAKDFRVYFITVDPERDAAELLKSYISAFDPRIIGVTGTPDEIAAVARAHRVFYRKVPTPSGYTMDHTATVFLFDRQGDLFGTLSTSDGDVSRRQKLERLLGS